MATMSKEYNRQYMREYRKNKPIQTVVKQCQKCGAVVHMPAKGKGKWRYCVLCKVLHC